MGTTIRQLHESAQELVRWLEWERESLELFHAYGQRYLTAGCNVYLGVLGDAERLRKTLAQIAGPVPCDLSGTWIGDNGVCKTEAENETCREMHRKHCSRCIARAVLEAK